MMDLLNVFLRWNFVSFSQYLPKHLLSPSDSDNTHSSLYSMNSTLLYSTCTWHRVSLFCALIISANIISSRLIQIVKKWQGSLPLKETAFYAHADHIVFIHLELVDMPLSLVDTIIQVSVNSPSLPCFL